MSHLSDTEILLLKKELIQQKNIISQQLENSENFGLGKPLKETTGELSVIDNHPADFGSEVFERGKDLALNENAENRLSSINLALDKIDEGHYGTCVTCGAAIPFERLEALPATEYCIQHSPERSVSQHRPIEEPIIAPDGDGEDFWKTVANWGTSSNMSIAFGNSDQYDADADAEGKDGFVEAYESFVATDLYGQEATFVRNDEYRKYIENEEGVGLLEGHSQVED